jgi:hypothetical protein
VFKQVNVLKLNVTCCNVSNPGTTIERTLPLTTKYLNDMMQYAMDFTTYESHGVNDVAKVKKLKRNQFPTLSRENKKEKQNYGTEAID